MSISNYELVRYLGGGAPGQVYEILRNGNEYSVTIRGINIQEIHIYCKLGSIQPCLLFNIEIRFYLSFNDLKSFSTVIFAKTQARGSNSMRERKKPMNCQFFFQISGNEALIFVVEI